MEKENSVAEGIFIDGDYYSKIHEENENDIEADKRWKQIFKIYRMKIKN